MSIPAVKKPVRVVEHVSGDGVKHALQKIGFTVVFISEINRFRPRDVGVK